MPVCLAAVRNQYCALTRIERQIADYVLSNSGAVVGMNVAQLAAAAGTAGSAVIRFCKSLGYSGYSQFRLALAQELAASPAPLPPPLKAGESPALLAQKVFDSSIRTLRNTAAMLDPAALEKLLDALSQAKRICTFGVGTSAAIAEDAHYRFLQLGCPASCYTDILFMSIAALNMKPKEVAFAVSHSGRTEATLEAMRLAKAQGAVTAAITSYRASPLAQLVDYPLVAYADETTYPVEAVSARLAHLCLLDVLATGLALRGGPAAAKRLAHKNQILEHIREKNKP